MTPAVPDLFQARRSAFARFWNFFRGRDRAAFEHHDIFQFALMTRPAFPRKQRSFPRGENNDDKSA
jgi:hypothetical protein